MPSWYLFLHPSLAQKVLKKYLYVNVCKINSFWLRIVILLHKQKKYHASSMVTHVTCTGRKLVYSLDQSCSSTYAVLYLSFRWTLPLTVWYTESLVISGCVEAYVYRNRKVKGIIYIQNIYTYIYICIYSYTYYIKSGRCSFIPAYPWIQFIYTFVSR